MGLNRALVLAAAIGALAAPSAFANEAIAQKSGCLACHMKDKKLVGPAYQEVAKKYKGQGDIAAKLVDKVRKGGVGAWGPIPMPPNDPGKISDDDLKTVVAWVLKL